MEIPEIAIVSDLDRVPSPAFCLLPNLTGAYRCSFRRDRYLTDRIAASEDRAVPFAPIVTSRGCVYQCRFCASSKRRRVRSVARVLEDVRDLINRDIQRLVFYDDLFCGPSAAEMARIDALAEGLDSFQGKATWSVELRADVALRMGEDRLARLHQVGMTTVNLGLERGSDSALNRDQKGLDTRTIRAALLALRRAGDITINGSFIFGGPGETVASTRETVDFACSLDLDFAAFYPLEVHPGTPLYEQARHESIVRPGLSDYLSMQSYPVYVNSQCTIEDVMLAKAAGYRRFYFSRRKLAAMLQQNDGDRLRVLGMYRYWKDYVPDLPIPTDWEHLIEMCS